MLAASAILISALAMPAPAHAQIMARGYYNHVESRVSFFIPEVTDPSQVTVENIMYEVKGNDGMIVPAIRHSYVDSRGSRHTVTSVDFQPHFEPHNSTVQYSMADAASNYRAMGTVIHDAGTRSDRIPAHQLHLRLPNGNILYVLFILHQDDELDQRRLLIAEAETAPRARQPGLFLASVGIINPEFFGTDADHTFWRVRYTPAGPPIHDAELVATQPWGLGQFEEVMSAGGEAVPE
jgi:hypothetical protein